jgi:hypothetical protein
MVFFQKAVDDNHVSVAVNSLPFLVSSAMHDAQQDTVL